MRDKLQNKELTGDLSKELTGDLSLCVCKIIIKITQWTILLCTLRTASDISIDMKSYV